MILYLPSAEVICTWSGHLPPKRHKNPTYSPRIFLGGVPWDITEASLIAGFRPFGGLSVDWPGKEGKHNRHPPKGYVYVTFESEKSVKALLTMCRFDPSEGGQWYYQVSSKRMRNKEVSKQHFFNNLFILSLYANGYVRTWVVYLVDLFISDCLCN